MAYLMDLQQDKLLESALECVACLMYPQQDTLLEWDLYIKGTQGTKGNLEKRLQCGLQ